MPLVSKIQPQLPATAELSNALPVYGTATQSFADVANHLVGYRMRRFVSTTVECDVNAEWRRVNNFPRSGDSNRDTYLLMRLSPEVNYLYLEIEFLAATATEKSTPSPSITATIEDTSAVSIDTITWSDLDPMPLVRGPADPDTGAGVARNGVASPNAQWVATGFTVDPSPGAGDTTPRPLIPGDKAGAEVVLKVSPTDALIVAIHYAEMYEAEI